MLLLQLITTTKADHEVHDADQTHDEDAENDSNEDVEINSQDHR
jgi:hypothetical protein